MRQSPEAGDNLARVRYEQIVEGEWFRPTTKHRDRCCDCGLIHRIEYKIVEGELWMRVWRDNRATAKTSERRKKTP